MPPRIIIDAAPLRESRDFRLLFAGSLVSTIGNQLTVVAIPFQVYALTHSSLQVGMISLAQLIPFVAGSLIGGSVGDAVDRRLLMIITGALLSVTSLLLAVNSIGGNPSLLTLYVVSAAAAGLSGISSTARTASVASLVSAEHLTAAFAFIQIIFQIGVVVGPALSGILLHLVGATWVYGIDAFTYLAAVLSAVLMAPLPPVADARRPGFGSIVEGIRYLKGRQLLQGVYLIDINAMVFGMPRALFPAMASGIFSYVGPPSVVLGFLYAAPGVGALVGAVTTGWVTRIRRQAAAVVVAVILWGAAIALFGLVHVFWIGLVLLAVAGWADVISAVLRNTLLQTNIPDTYRSRLSSIQMAVVQGGPRLGDLESGAVAELTSVEFSIVSGGLASIAGAVILALVLPGFRTHLRDQAPHDADVAGNTEPADDG
jgi:MFS family permease